MHRFLYLVLLVYATTITAGVPPSFFLVRTGPYGGQMGIDAVPLDPVSPVVPPSPFTLKQLDPALYFTINYQFNAGLTQPSIPDNSAKREFSVYLPPQISDTSRTFPVVYYLHGDLSDHVHTAFQIQPGFKGDYLTLLDTLINDGKVIPMIMIFGSQTVPAQFTGCAQEDPIFTFTYSGADYFDNPMGMMETFHTYTLRQYVDANYPTLTTAQKTVIGGHSQGAIGTARYPSRHATEYNGFYADAGLLNLTTQHPQLLRGFIEVWEGWGLQSVRPLAPPYLSCSLLDTFAAFANQVTYPDPTNPGFSLRNTSNPVYSNGINLSANYGRVIYQAILDVMYPPDLLNQIDSFTSEFQKARIFTTQGLQDRNVAYFPCKAIGDHMTSLGIDYRWLTHNGDHNTITYPSTPPLNTGLSEDDCLLIFASAAFQEDPTIDARRIKFVGSGTITLQNNAHFTINNDAIIGVETNGATSATSITLNILDSAVLSLGSTATAGGGFQIGNQIDSRFLVDNPALASKQVSCALNINGPAAQFKISQQGFFGLGVGLKGKYGTTPEEWVVTSLQNLENITINVNQGMFTHDLMYTTTNAHASLLAMGTGNDQYTFILGRNGKVCGGGNIIQIQDSVGMHPVVRTDEFVIPNLNPPAILPVDFPIAAPFINLQSEGGLHTIFLPSSVSPLADFLCRGIPTYVIARDPSAHAYIRGMLASALLLRSFGQPEAPTNGSGSQLLSYLSTMTYDSQFNKRCNIAPDPFTGNIDIGFTDTGITSPFTLIPLGSIERKILETDMMVGNTTEIVAAITKACAATIVRRASDGRIIYIGDATECPLAK